MKPDLILTQAQCDVCAVNEATVRAVAAQLTDSPTVESVNPTTLTQVFAMFTRIGTLLDASAEADQIIAGFHATAQAIEVDQPPRRLVLLEWVDPPYSSGHWNPEIIALAGGVEPLAIAGQPSRRVTWEMIAAADPDVILIAACGFGIDRTIAELKAIDESEGWTQLRAVQQGQVAVTDGSAYFSRPGPRLEASLRIAAAALNRASEPFLTDDRSMVWLNELA